MFIRKLNAAWSDQNSLLCVGLDPDLERLPAHFKNSRLPFFEFNREIIDATADLVCAFKPQLAHYAAYAAEAQLEKTIDYIRNRYPAIPIVLDAKRGDIGNTAKMYAREVFDRYNADAVTVNPYLGGDSLNPFLERKDKGVIIVCLTSNPGAQDFQNLICESEPIYEIVAKKAVRDWNKNGNVLLVTGATFPEGLAKVRAIAGDMPFLVPGLGVQAGKVGSAVANGRDSQGTGMIMSCSRAVLYASADNSFADKAREVAQLYRDQINFYRFN